MYRLFFRFRKYSIIFPSVM